MVKISAIKIFYAFYPSFKNQLSCPPPCFVTRVFLINCSILGGKLSGGVTSTKRTSSISSQSSPNSASSSPHVSRSNSSISNSSDKPASFHKDTLSISSMEKYTHLLKLFCKPPSMCIISVCTRVCAYEFVCVDKVRRLTPNFRFCCFMLL